VGAELPIEAIVPAVVAELDAGRNLVVQADPGAGKTTRLPEVMLAHGWAEHGEIWVAQPRRIAARLAAVRVASQRGEGVGATIGYQVRFDSKTSAATRVRFVTEGILARRLLDDPALPGIGAIVFDEFHERHLDGDLALALVRALQRGARPELRIAVMSATLDPGPVATYLDATPLRSAGRAYPVTIEHATDKSDRPLGVQVASALRDVGRDGLDGGSALVFLPGAREIRECAEACAHAASALDLEIVVLHGELPGEEQDRAVRPGSRAKLVLATNVAETSITIEGVSCVIDSGLVRQASHDPWTGLGALVLGKASKASAQQRAGRAGRTRAGRCVRLFSRADYDRRSEFDPPEIVRSDLAGAALAVRAAGFERMDAVPWFEPPPVAAVRGAEDLLARLGAIDEGGKLSARGRELMKHPVHPRLARLLQAGRELGVPHAAAGAAALLSERSIRRGGPDRRTRASIAASSDVVVDLDDLRAFESEPGRAHSLGLDAGACRTVLEVWRQLARGGTKGREQIDDDALGMALLAGFPDRVAAVRPGAPGARRKLAFAGGSGQAELADESAVHGASFVVALQAESRREGAGTNVLVRSAAAIEPEWLVDLDAARLEDRKLATFDAERERVEATVETRWDGLLIESRRDPRPSDATTRALLDAARARGPAAWADPDEVAQVVHRATFVRAHDPSANVPTAEMIDAALASACEDRTSFAQLRQAGILDAVLGGLGADRDRFDRRAPTHVTLKGGRRVKVHYEIDRAPWIESRMQDFFGTPMGPTVMEGRVPVAIHLLAPNGRAEQITTDLAGFWVKVYPEVRRALMRRYPRHDWPEDPLHATPSAPRRR
jgi:ATP-dependent helicase HrpB